MRRHLCTATAARRALARATKPLVCYHVDGLPAKKGGEALYAKLRTAVAEGNATLRESLTIPACDARSWRLSDPPIAKCAARHSPRSASAC